MISDFVQSLRIALSEKLPGAEAQYEMAHSSFRHESLYTPSQLPEDVRLSAVLALLYPKEESLNLCLIQRTASNFVHSKQIGFPGGGLEEQDDQDLLKTALREAQEEVNIIPDNVDILGQLTDLFIPVSNNLVYPYVGYSAFRPEFIPEPREVEYVIEAPLNTFLSKDNIKLTTIQASSKLTLKDIPYYDINGHVVWGATAMMLSELVTIINKI